MEGFLRNPRDWDAGASSLQGSPWEKHPELPGILHPAGILIPEKRESWKSLENSAPHHEPGAVSRHSDSRESRIPGSQNSLGSRQSSSFCQLRPRRTRIWEFGNSGMNFWESTNHFQRVPIPASSLQSSPPGKDFGIPGSGWDNKIPSGLGSVFRERSGNCGKDRDRGSCASMDGLKAGTRRDGGRAGLLFPVFSSAWARFFGISPFRS